MLKPLFSKLGVFLKTRWAYFVSLLFFWVIPIIILGEVVSLYEVDILFKLTFMGLAVIVVILLAFRKKIVTQIEKVKHGTVKAVLLIFNKALTYGLILGIFWAITSFIGGMFDWWKLSGISMLIGCIFIVIDEKRAEKNESN